MQSNLDYLDKKSTSTLRGILVIMIVIHHMYQYRFIQFINPYVGVILQNLGFWSVSLFLFLSGYALMYSNINKKSYLKSFFNKKIIPITISYIIFIIIYLLFFKISEGYYRIFRLWYLETCIFMYLVFYISFRNKNQHICFWAGIAIYYIICVLLNAKISYYATALCFPLGVYWCINKTKIDKKISIHKLVYLIASVILFTCAFVCSKLLPNSVQVLKDILFIISNMLFVILFLQLCKIKCVVNSILIKIGQNSLEIYAVQFLYLLMFNEIYIVIYPVVVLFCSLITGFTFHLINTKIIKLIIKEA